MPHCLLYSLFSLATIWLYTKINKLEVKISSLEHENEKLAKQIEDIIDAN